MTPATVAFLEEGDDPGTWRCCGPGGGWDQAGLGQPHHQSDDLCLKFVSEILGFFSVGLIQVAFMSQ